MKPSEVSQALYHCVEIHRPAFVWGPVGVGKSEVVAQLAANMGRELRDVRLSLMDPVDIKGFPVPDTANGVMTWLPPGFLPAMTIKGARGKVVPNDSQGIIFLDEMNSAPPSVQAAAYQFVLNRRIGEYVLPDGWDIIAAGNRASDRSVVHNMPAALSNRLVHIDFEVDIEEWSSWAVTHDIDPNVLAFLRFKSAMLHQYDGRTNPRAFPTPRTWAFVSDSLKHQSASRRLSSNVELELLSGMVGDAAAKELKAFIDIARDLPSIDQVLLNPRSAVVPTAPAAKWAISTTLAMRANRDNVENLLLYMERMEPEFQVVFARDAGRRDATVLDSKAFTTWSIKNSDVIG